MGLFSFLQSWRGGTAAKDVPEEAGETYRGYRIIPCPRPEGGQYRLAATIRKGEREHYLIRADLIADHDACIDHSLRKARTLIDEQGDRLFGP